MNHPVTRPRRAVRAAGALACGAVGVLVAAGPAAAEGHGGGRLPDPETHTNLSAEVRCGDLTPEADCDHEFTIDVAAGLDLLTTGTYTDAATGLAVTIGGLHVNADGRAVVDLTSNLPLNSVLVRSGPRGELYEFDDAVTSVDALVALTATIGELSFCYDEPPDDGVPPTEPSTPPTEPSSTTQPAGTTPTTVKPPEDTTTTTAAPSTTSEPSTTTTMGEELPETGSNSTMVLVAVGAALLAAGTGLVLGTRRVWRRHA
jgi:LPXTG-motif cell wall-anchored protein